MPQLSLAEIVAWWQILLVFAYTLSGNQKLYWPLLINTILAIAVVFVLVVGTIAQINRSNRR